MAFVVIYDAGKLATAQSFDGVNDSVDIAAFSGLPAANLTVSAWVNLGQNKNFNRIVNHEWTTTNGSWLLYSNDTDVLFGIMQGGSLYHVNGGGLVPGQWHYVVATYDGSTMRIYVDGVTGTTRVISQALDTDGPVIIGGRIASNFLDGSIDEVRIDSRTQSPEWIQTEFNNQNDPAAFISCQTAETL